MHDCLVSVRYDLPMGLFKNDRNVDAFTDCLDKDAS